VAATATGDMKLADKCESGSHESRETRVVRLSAFYSEQRVNII
jgi:hypothetical protein